MYEWIPSNKTPGINKARKLLYLGESTTCDTGYMGFDPESREVKTVYNVIFDEDSSVRRNNLRTFDKYRKMKNSTSHPDFIEEMVFDGSDVQYHADAVRQLFSAMPEEEMVVPLEDVNASADGEGASTTGGEVAENTQPSEQPTDGLTTQSPPVNTVDNTDNIQPLSYDGLDSNDSNDLSDTTSLDDGSENIDMPTESKQSKNRVSDVKDEIPYREIVYDDHNRTYTKKFEEEDEQVRLRSESEKSG